MKFYNIKDSYINYLRQYDSKVAENKKESRPYVGIVFKINDIKYYAPFSSPKPKHQEMKNSKDFRKINHGIYGAINFNNMIPITDDALILIDIANLQDEQYKRLLQNQYNAIRSDKLQIIKTASALHTLIFTPDNQLNKHDLTIKQRCCNLNLLETIYKNFKQPSPQLPQPQFPDTQD